jgi:hypothetical protein
MMMIIDEMEIILLKLEVDGTFFGDLLGFWINRR